jgi:hypothetical protein
MAIAQALHWLAASEAASRPAALRFSIFQTLFPGFGVVGLGRLSATSAAAAG